MNKPNTIYMIYNITDDKIETSRIGSAYIKPMDAVNEIARLKYIYPNHEYELLEYERWK